MAEVDGGSPDAARAKLDAIALAEQAEAEAAEADALAAAARARARAIKLRREAEVERATQADADDEVAAPDVGATATDIEVEHVETQTPESTGSAESDADGRRWHLPRVSLALTIAAVVAIVGLLGASGWMAWRHYQAGQDHQQAAEYVAAARQGVVNLTSLDFNKAKEDVQRVLDSATGEFKDDFQRRAADFESVVKDSKAVTEGSVTMTALESMNKNSAVVLVLANERVTNIAGAKDQPRTFRFRVSVVHDGAQLKVSKVEFVL
jgi:Mce-associated membrane protein